MSDIKSTHTQQGGFHVIPPFPSDTRDDEIDLKELFIALWHGKWTIILVTFLFSVAGVVFALNQPNTYKAQALLTATQGGGSGGISGSLGNLAAFAGVSLGGGNQADPKVEALAVLQSRKFIEAFIEKHKLLAPLMALESWNESHEEIRYDSELYNVSTGKWMLDENGESLKPTLWEAHKAFKEILSVSENKDNGMVTVSVVSESPFLASQWTTLLVEDINLWMKEQALKEASSKIAYLEKQITKTSITELQNMFYSLIEEQYKTQMLAEVEEEFVFKTIDPAVVPEDKDGPKRALICVLATLLGGMLGVAVVLVKYAFRKEDKNND